MLTSRMNPEAIRGIVLEMIHSIAPETDTRQVPLDSPLRRAIELDSLDWLNVIAGLEERFSLEIPPCDHEHLSTVDALVDYVAAR